MALTNTLDEIFYIIFGVIDEAFWPILGVFMIIAFFGFLMWGSGNGKK